MTLPKLPTRLRDANIPAPETTNAGAKALRCTRCHKAAAQSDGFGGICVDCWNEINYPDEALYRRRKSWSSLKAVLIAFVLAFGLATEAHPWTLTAKGTVTLAQTDGVHPGPFAGDLNGLPYVMTITSDPELNGLVDQDDAWTHITRGGTMASAAAAPYTIRLTVNGHELIQTEPFPGYNRAILQRHPVSLEHTIVQDVRSNGCSWSYGLCIQANIQAGSLTTFLSTLDFDQTSLKINGKILIPSSSAISFQFRNGPIAQQTVQEYSYFYGSIDSLVVRQER